MPDLLPWRPVGALTHAPEDCVALWRLRPDMPMTVTWVPTGTLFTAADTAWMPVAEWDRAMTAMTDPALLPKGASDAG